MRKIRRKDMSSEFSTEPNFELLSSIDHGRAKLCEDGSY